jgi:methionyl aminopeptidase
MITIKSPAEFEKMEFAGRCVAAMHGAVREAIKPGVTTKELDDIAARVAEGMNCVPSFFGYGGAPGAIPFPGVLCTSPNDVIVHGIPGGTVLEEGDLISIDAGAIFEGYHGDAAFTVGVGDIAPQVQALIDVTEQAMWAGIAHVKHGARLGDIGAAVQAAGDRGGYGIVREYVGHGIGRAMHEEPQVPNYGRRGKGMRLRTGMAVCIEPMFNAGSPATRVDPDLWTVRTADGSLSAHWEHTVCITPDGPVVTTVPAGVQAEVGPPTG